MKVIQSVLIKAEIDEVWNVISEARNLEKCHPFCHRNEVIVWDRDKSIDEIVYYNGRKMRRTFIDWKEGSGYELLIGQGKNPDASVTWSIKRKKGCSELTIQLELFIHNSLEHVPMMLRKLVAKVYLVPMMNAYLKSVLAGFKFHIETGEKVQKNQFGNNQLFSTKS